MKKVLIIFLLITAASCGGKSTEEQAMADSIAAAAAADSIAAAEAANGEILIISYELFKNDGYNGSFQQFKKLLAQNPDALNHMYTLYSNQKGYAGDLGSYLKLLEIVPEASPEELRVLYDVLFEAKETTYTYDEFSVAWKEQVRYKDVVFDLVYNNSLYWSEREIFFQKYYSSNFFIEELYELILRYDETFSKRRSLENFKSEMKDYEYAKKVYEWLSSNVSTFPNSSRAKFYFKKLEMGGGFTSKEYEFKEPTNARLFADDDIYLFTAFALILSIFIFIILIRKKVNAFFVNRKLQDYFLIVIAIPLLIIGLFILSSSTIIQLISDDQDEEILFGILSSFIGAIFLIALHKRKFVDFILFFLVIAGFMVSPVMFFENSGNLSPLVLIPSLFTLFVLWKDNFFTKESRNTPLDGTREKGKRMLEELREMGPDESMVGKTVIKKTSVKKEEDKNSTEE